MDVEAISSFAGANLNVLLAVAAVRPTLYHQNFITVQRMAISCLRPFINEDTLSTDGFLSQNAHVSLQVLATTILLFVRNRIKPETRAPAAVPPAPIDIKLRVAILNAVLPEFTQMISVRVLGHSDIEQLLLRAGYPPDNSDSIFVLNELREAASRSISSAPCRAAQVWQSKEELQRYFKDTIVSIAEVTGVNQFSVAYALQSNLGSVVGAMKDVVSSTELHDATASAQPTVSLPDQCMLEVCTTDCSGTVLTCPSCGLAACSACHMHSVLSAERFPICWMTIPHASGL